MLVRGVIVPRAEEMLDDDDDRSVECSIVGAGEFTPLVVCT